MSQYINLFGPAFRKPQLLLTLNRAAMLAGLAAVVMIGVHLYSRQQVKGLREETASAQGLLKAQKTYTDRLKGEGAGQAGNAGLSAEVQRLEMELKSARDSMGVLQSGAIGNRDGFAGYLQAFSRQSLDGLWLTGFTVGGAGEVAIHGRAISADLLPQYIQKMNREPVLKGRGFSVLELRRPKPVAETAGKGGDKADASQLVPRYLEFDLTTGDSGDSGAPGGNR